MITPGFTSALRGIAIRSRLAPALTDIMDPSGSTPGTVTAIDTATNTVTSTTTGIAGGPNGIALFTIPAPTVTSISPNTGPLAAGTPVTITGTNLAGATAVTFGAAGPATGVSCTATTCTAIAPAGTAGTVDVTVTGPGGTSVASPADQYTYIAAPVVTGISPIKGLTAGGTVVTISGSGLSGATAVTFGAGNNATGVSCTATTCTATAPAETAGTVDVQVTTIGGSSATSSADQYTYVAPFAFTGFFQPVDNLPAENAMKAGAAVPVKFALGGDQGLSILNPGYPASIQINCASGVPIDPIETTVTAGSSSLQYDGATGQYTYVWKTDKAWKGTCRQLDLQFTDGTDHLANFLFN